MGCTIQSGVIVSARFHRGALLVLATAWAAAMASAGFWVTLEAPRMFSSIPGTIRIQMGLAGILGGAFLFMVLVADRLFPRADRRVVTAAEAITFLGFLVGLIVSGVWLVSSGGMG